jgi:hypothetical protein
MYDIHDRKFYKNFFEINFSRGWGDISPIYLNAHYYGSKKEGS